MTLLKKYEKTIFVTLGEPWEEHHRQFHNEFIQSFGQLQARGQVWSLSEFFTQLTRIRVYCDHPILARKELIESGELIDWNWQWQDSAKIVHLMEHLVNFLPGDDEQQIQKRKAVIFSSFVTFLKM